jgi:hypothetical protein
MSGRTQDIDDDGVGIWEGVDARERVQKRDERDRTGERKGATE